MATVYLADNYSQPMPTAGFAGIQMVRDFLFTVSTAFVINDTVKLCQIPGISGIVVDNWFLSMPDLDTHTTPLVRVQLGDTDTADKFMAAYDATSTADDLAAKINGVVAILPVSYSANKDLILKVSTAPATGATGVVIKGQLYYHEIGPATPV